MKIFYLVLFVSIYGCNNNQHILANTKWMLKKWSIDNRNYLSPLDKKGINQFTEFADSIKLYMEFRDTLAFTYVENSEVDTSIYEIRDDTVFFMHRGNYNDTDIIVKLSEDSLIMYTLAGSRTYQVRQK